MSAARSRKRLLFVVNVDWFFLSHRLPIALEAMRQGYEVHVAAASTGRDRELEGLGLQFHPLPLDRSSMHPLAALHDLLVFYRLFRTLCPDLVHLVTIKPVLLGGIAARLAGIPRVVAAVSGLGHVFIARGWTAALRRGLVAWLYRLAFGMDRLRVIFQNGDDLACIMRLTGLPADKVVVIKGSGVDLGEYIAHPLPAGTPVVLFAARFLIDKGIREFVEVARRMRAAGILARFCLVGAVDRDNPNSCSAAELERWLADGVVEYWGFRPDMPEVMRQAHLVVLPSYYGEGLPKVLIEAAACARPVVTTDWPGCRDAIEPGRSGVLVPVRDVAALEQAIRGLLDDPARCVAMGLAGRAFAERAFSVARVVAGHLDVYRELFEAE